MAMSTLLFALAIFFTLAANLQGADSSDDGILTNDGVGWERSRELTEAVFVSSFTSPFWSHIHRSDRRVLFRSPCNTLRDPWYIQHTIKPSFWSTG